MSSPQSKWNARNPEKVRASKAKYNQQQTRIQFNLHPDRHKAAIAFLQSRQQEGESLSQCAMRLLLAECDRNLEEYWD